MNDGGSKPDAGLGARRLIRSGAHGALGTLMEGTPYVSLVALACDFDASPLLLLSDLAQHTRNLLANARVSLLFEATAGYADPLAGPRLTVIGRAERCDEPRAIARFTARHPSSAQYAEFGDFNLYRVVVEQGHLVAGFGRISWVDTAELQFGGDASALAAAETDIVAHMNQDHADALDVYAERLLQLTGAGWRMTGIDPEGLDLRRNGEIARLDFELPVLTPAAARRILVALAETARQSAGRS
jgi:putative heme iron utilization protein